MEIEYVIGMRIMVRKAGMDSEKSSSGMSLIGLSMNSPTNTRAGQTAEPGMAVKTGAKNSASTKQAATENPVRH